MPSTTKAFVSILNTLMRDKEIGKLIVPIIPDEARTFGMDGMFRSFGIYASMGQLYEPVDKDKENVAAPFYKEAKNGQLLEEGINEAGAMSSFIAAGSAYSTHGINTIPFYIYYSMFGPQRVGDLIWLAADMRVKGFLLGGTAGRTTLNGEGLQHEDGHSHLLLYPVPNLISMTRRSLTNWRSSSARAFAACMKWEKTSSTTSR
jgi:pyruvate dehydrogenase E1 component